MSTITHNITGGIGVGITTGAGDASGPMVVNVGTSLPRL